jgi:hypothetical protein
MMRVGLTFEYAVPIKRGLLQHILDVLPWIQLRMVDGDSVRKEIVEQPQCIVRYEHEAHEIVKVNGRPEIQYLRHVDVANLESCKYQQNEAEGVRPVPHSHGKRVQVNALHR